MKDSKDLTQAALLILKRWHWGRIDPDGSRMFISIMLDVTVNRLAFAEHDDPSNAILELLCDGKLIATCNYQWLKFSHLQTFRSSGETERIDPAKWKKLARMLSEARGRGEGDSSEVVKLDLIKLEIEGCEPAEWCPKDNRCSFASRSTDSQPNQESYFEEWFTATNIQVALSSSLLTELYQPEETSDTEELIASDSTENKPALSESELKKWWTSKARVHELLSQEELVVLISAKYPDHFISRKRIRTLTGPRKRGPKR